MPSELRKGTIEAPLKGGVALKVQKEFNESSEKISFPSCRLVLTLMGFLFMINLYAMRVNLSIAIVAMVNQTWVKQNTQVLVPDNNTVAEVSAVSSFNDTLQDKNKSDGSFEWSTKLQGLILGAFFYGYICTQIIGGLMAQRFGSKRLMFTAISVNSFLCLATPVATKLAGAPILVAIRILQGIFQGISLPSTHALISKWAPPFERSKIGSFIYAGVHLGTVVANPIGGLLASYSWESIFYLFGLIGAVYTLVFYFLIFDDPNQHPRIQDSEKEYIIKALGDMKQKPISLKDIPWKSIFTSIRLHALMVANFAFMWSFYTMLTCLPLYFSNVFHFNIKSNGAIAALPYLASWFLMLVSGYLADLLISKQILSTTIVRKLATLIGLLVPAALFVGVGYVFDATYAVACIVAAMGVSGVSWAGWSVNHLDLAPNYAGTLMGLTNTIGTISGFAGPALVSYLTVSGHTIEAWRAVFFVAAAINSFGAVFFCIFGSGKKQRWADPIER